MAWDLLEEDFADLTDWTDNDWGNGVSAISPAGQLHQDTVDAASGTSGARIYQDIGSIGSGDFTAEFKVKFDRSLVTAGTGPIIFTFGGATENIWVRFSSTALLVYGSVYNTGITKTWALDTWYTIRIIIHNSQTDADFYLDGVEQNTDVDCANSLTVDDGLCYIRSGNNDTRQEWHTDYLYIGSGQQVPSTTSIKKVSSIEYASIKEVSGVAIASVSKIAGIE